MDALTDLEKLAGLKKKGVITNAEFEEQKKAILSAQIQAKQVQLQKSGALYLVLAFLVGIFGIHNFYVGRWVRGLIQLILTLLSPISLLISLFGVCIWVIVEMIVTKTDVRGMPLTPAPVLRGVLTAILLILLLLPVLTVFIIGGIAGYTQAMWDVEVDGIIYRIEGDGDTPPTEQEARDAVKKYQANASLDYMMMCAVTAQASFSDGSVNTVPCSELIDEEVPDALAQDFYFIDQGTELVTVMTFKDEQSAALVREQSSDALILTGTDSRVYVRIPY